MKKYIILLSFLLSGILFSKTEANIKPEEKRDIIKTANSFLKALKNKNKNEASLYIHGESVKKLSQGEKKKLIDSFIKGEIKEIEYRTKMASHYAALFTSDPQSRILIAYKTEDAVYKGNIEEKTEYYFIYAESKYDIVYNADGENSMAPASVKMKIEIIKTDNTYKIIGFSS